jgi:hypothetical protein
MDMEIHEIIYGTYLDINGWIHMMDLGRSPMGNHQEWIYTDVSWFMRRSTYMDNSFRGNGHTDTRNISLESYDQDRFNAIHKSFKLKETFTKYCFFMNYHNMEIYLLGQTQDFYSQGHQEEYIRLSYISSI